jgi:hypothetical protein
MFKYFSQSYYLKVSYVNNYSDFYVQNAQKIRRTSPAHAFEVFADSAEVQYGTPVIRGTIGLL